MISIRNGYLIGAVDLAAPADQNWKKLVDKALEERDLKQITLFDPAAPWLMNGDYIHSAQRRLYIESVNRAAMELSDFAIANLPKCVSSIGSPIEVDWYFNERRPIIVATDIPYGSSIYLANRVSRDLYCEYAPGTSPKLIAEMLAFTLEKLAASADGAEETEQIQRADDSTTRAYLRRGNSIKDCCEKGYPEKDYGVTSPSTKVEW